MTTSVTVKTHDWPVKVTFYDSYHSEGPKSRTNTNGYTEEFVEANSERELHLTDTRSISFEELPKEATDLDHADKLKLGID